MRAIGYFWAKETGIDAPQHLERAFYEYCSEHRHQPMAAFVDTSISKEEPNSKFSQVIEYIRNSGSGFLLLIPDATHLGSALEDIARAMVELEGYKSKVQCMDEEFPDPLQSALYYIGIKGVSREHSEKVKEAMQSKAQQGRGLGRPPYGYHIGSKGKLEVVPEEAAIVQLIFDLYTSKNLGLRKIAEYLNQKDITNRNGVQWNIINVRDILKNITYLGIYTRFGFRIPKNHPQIVLTDTFHTAQSLMRQRKPRRRWSEVEPYLLSGLAFCGYCGNKMIGVTRRQSWRRQDRSRAKGVYRYYQCQSRANKSACGYHTWRASQLEDETLNLIRSAAEAGSIFPSEAFKAAIPSQEEVRTAEKRFIRAFKTASDGLMSLSTLNSHLEHLNTVRQAKDIGKFKDNETLHGNLLERWELLDTHERQTLLKGLISKITVWDDNVHVQYHVSSPPSLLQSE